MKVIVDRFEGDFAVCEKVNLEMIDIEINKLPKEVQEGDVLIITDQNIIIDDKETEERETRIRNLMNSLWK